MPSIIAYEALDTLKARVKGLPAKPTRETRKQEKDKLKELCIKIFAYRRSARAERNNKEGLQQTTIFTEDAERMAAKLKEDKIFDEFLDKTSYDLSGALEPERFEDTVQEMKGFNMFLDENNRIELQKALNEAKAETVNAFNQALALGRENPAPQVNGPVANLT